VVVIHVRAIGGSSVVSESKQNNKLLLWVCSEKACFSDNQKKKKINARQNMKKKK
jgi:hypothetical protein